MNKRIRRALVICLVLGGFSVSVVAADGDDNMREWQLGLLFEPSGHQLEMERRGRVFIFDGMHSADIDRAFEEQFDRIDSMMFTGTIITDSDGVPVMDPETGLLLVLDDGC